MQLALPMTEDWEFRADYDKWKPTHFIGRFVRQQNRMSKMELSTLFKGEE